MLAGTETVQSETSAILRAQSAGKFQNRIIYQIHNSDYIQFREIAWSGNRFFSLLAQEGNPTKLRLTIKQGVEMRFFKALSVTMIAFCATGCATVINGPNIKYEANTTPKGANVVFTNGGTCTTPCKISLRRKEDTRADITLVGYDPTYILIQSKLGGASFGNILLGGGVGAIVDGANGASNRLSPSPLIVQLAPAGSGKGAQLLDKKGSVVMSVKAHNDSVRTDVTKTIGAKLSGLEGNAGLE